MMCATLRIRDVQLCSLHVCRMCQAREAQHQPAGATPHENRAMRRAKAKQFGAGSERR